MMIKTYDDKILCFNNMTLQYVITEFAKHYPILVAQYAILLILYPIRFVLLPHLMGKLYYNVNKKSDMVLKYIVIIAGIIVVIQLGNVWGDNVEMQMFLKLQKHIRDIMIRHIFNAESHVYDQLEVGHLVSQIGKLPSTYYHFLDHVRNIYVPNIFTVVVSAIYFIYMIPKTGLVFALIILIWVWGMYRIISRCLPLAYKRDKEYNKMIKGIDDILKNKDTVMTFDQVENELNRLGKAHDTYAFFTTSGFRCSLSNHVSRIRHRLRTF